MPKVTNDHGNSIDYGTAVQYMDDGLREYLHRAWEGEDDDLQGFFDQYCELHRAKFGEEFIANERNPQW